MITIKNDNIVFVDVDDTLIKWNVSEHDTDIVYINFSGERHKHSVIRANVDALLKHNSRNHAIVVWSQGGFQWAEAVVKALGLESKVTAVMSKPKFLIDDLQSNMWMPIAKLHKSD